MIFALGFTLEKVAAMQEHGIKGVPAFQDLRDNLKLISISLSIFQGNMGMTSA
jgi:hypothetical protein